MNTTNTTSTSGTPADPIPETWFILRQRGGERAVWRTAAQLGWGPEDAARAEKWLQGFDGSGTPDDAYEWNAGDGTMSYKLPAKDGGPPLVCCYFGHCGRSHYTVLRGPQVVTGFARGYADSEAGTRRA